METVAQSLALNWKKGNLITFYFKSKRKYLAGWQSVYLLKLGREYEARHFRQEGIIR